MPTRSQSAMEYLTTYGWAILVVAVVVLVLFKVGVFNNGNSVGSGSCIAVSGFQCTKPILYSSGGLSASIGEIGQSITVTGTGCSINSTSPSISPTITSISLASSQTAILNFSCPVSSTKVGTIFTGSLWIRYNTGLQTAVVQLVGKIKVPISSAASGAVVELARVPINVINTQASSTGSNFQQMIYFNPSQTAYSVNEASDLGNIRFYQGGAELYSWCESGCTSSSSNAVFWVKLPGGIGANNHVNLNMTFLPSNTNYDGAIAGECPTCTVTGNTVVSYSITFNVISNASAGSSLSLNPHQFTSNNLWICGVAESGGNNGPSTNFTYDYNDGDYPTTQIGTNTGSQCTANDFGEWSGVEISLNDNGITPTSQGSSGDETKDNNWDLSVASTSFVVIINACGAGQVYVASTDCVVTGLPASCTSPGQVLSSDNGAETQIWSCNSVAAGTYNLDSSVVGGGNGPDQVMAAYLFTNVTTSRTNYGQYDNGAKVFNFYDNFSGMSLSPQWSVVYSDPTDGITVDNGLTFSGGSGWVFMGSTTGFNPQTSVFDTYAYSAESTEDQQSNWGYVGNWGGLQQGSPAEYQYLFVTLGSGNYGLGNYNGASLGECSAIAGATTNTYFVTSLYTTTSATIGSVNYGATSSCSSHFSASSSARSIGYQSGAGRDGTIYADWVRVRALPPNGVMPTASLGAYS